MRLRSPARSMLAAGLAASGLLVFGAAGAAAADEGQVSVSDGTLVYVAAADDVANHVTLSQPSAARFVVRDTGAPLVAGVGCVHVAADRVRCAIAGDARASLDLGPGNDTARVLPAIPTTQDGGAGADRLTGGPGADALSGGDGADRLLGGDGADSLHGDAQNDVLDGGPGADSMHGETGVDTATYALRTEAVTVTVDDLADDGGSADGVAGARDDVATDVENVIGGSGDDSLAGSAINNMLDGRAGADRYSGLAGVDTVTYALRTEPVTVTIDDLADDGGPLDGPAGARDDVGSDVENVIGGNGDDSLTGSAAANRLTGRPGADVLRGLDGTDVLVANDGVADLELDCGGGLRDAVLVDPLDPVSVGCERVRS
jgi:Ca2+-binding RTX toxin-like protein